MIHSTPRANSLAGPHPAMIPMIVPDFRSKEIPRQPTVELERAYRKQRLAVGYRLFARAGFDMGGAGHITARDPEHPDHFWVNPAGIHFSQIQVSDLMLVSHDGTILQPPANASPILNRAAFAIHSELHKSRPDVVAAAHSHSLYGKAWAALGRLLDPITQDSAAFYEDHALFDDFTGVVFEPGEGRRIAAALGSMHAIILKNHGLLTVGETVEAAVWRYLALENACQTQLIAQAAGPVASMRHDVARKTASDLGGEVPSMVSFKPYWDIISQEEPDLFD